MRFFAPKPGQVRQRSGFLWIPRYAAGEWRWLEPATWLERFTQDGHWQPYLWANTRGRDTNR